MNAILNDRCQIAEAVNATVISLDEAPQGYQDFDQGASKRRAATAALRSPFADAAVRAASFPTSSV